MIKHLSFFLALTTLFSCTKHEELRKLSVKEYDELSIQDIREGVNLKEIEISYFDAKGNEYSLDSINSMRPDTIGFDYYVNQDNVIKKAIIRSRTSEDDFYQGKFDSLLKADTEFLYLFVESVAVDEETKEGIISYYTSSYSKEIDTPCISCDSVYHHLLDAFYEDQSVRTEGGDMDFVDRTNQALLKKIVEQCGLTSIEKEGNEVVHAAFMIVQHSNLDMMKEYIGQFTIWTNDGLLPKSTLALMIDRIRTRENKPQLFGTQVRSYHNGGSEFYPIEDIENLEYRRDSVGLGPIEDYAAHFGIEWSSVNDVL